LYPILGEMLVYCPCSRKQIRLNVTTMGILVFLIADIKCIIQNNEREAKIIKDAVFIER
jgi:hypothetical protein